MGKSKKVLRRAAGGLLYILTRKSTPRMYAKEALVTTGLSWIIMSFFAFSAIYSAVWGVFFFLQDYADSTGQYFVYGLEAPFERPDSVQLLLIGTALIFVATFLIVLATAHEGRRKN